MSLNEQQIFWKEKYSKDYIEKNSNFSIQDGIKCWSKMLERTEKIETILECGSNIGRNIHLLNHLLPSATKSIIEISEQAYKIVTSKYQIHQSFNGPIAESAFKHDQFDFVFTMGVLIHIHPDDVLDNMEKMFQYSKRYILMGEYFNRTPVMLEYHGEVNKLFKSDFGKLFIQNFPVKLLDYGFLWGHLYDDAGFDDITYWLFEKR